MGRDTILWGEDPLLGSHARVTYGGWIPGMTPRKKLKLGRDAIGNEIEHFMVKKWFTLERFLSHSNSRSIPARETENLIYLKREEYIGDLPSADSPPHWTHFFHLFFLSYFLPREKWYTAGSSGIPLLEEITLGCNFLESNKKIRTKESSRGLFLREEDLE